MVIFFSSEPLKTRFLTKTYHKKIRKWQPSQPYNNFWFPTKHCGGHISCTRPNFGPQEETFKFITALNKVSKGIIWIAGRISEDNHLHPHYISTSNPSTTMKSNNSFGFIVCLVPAFISVEFLSRLLESWVYVMATALFKKQVQNSFLPNLFQFL
jgi:hypothetical protein